MPIQNLEHARVTLRKHREMVGDVSLLGTVSASGNPHVVGLNSENLTGAKTFRRSGRSSSSLLPGGRRRTEHQSGGPLDVDLVPGNLLREYLEEGLCGVMAADLAISATTISADDADNSLNGSGGSEFANVVVGQWVKVGGFSTAANNTDGASGRPYGAMVQSKPSDAKIILAYHTLTTEAAGQTVTVNGRNLTNGQTLISNTYERDHTDATTDRYQAYVAAVVNAMQIQINKGEFMRLVLDLLSDAPADASNTSVFSGLTDAPVEAFDSKSTTMASHFMAFREGGVLSGNLNNWTINHQNNLTKVNSGLELGVEGWSLGAKSLTGTLNGYLIDAATRRAAAFADTPTDFHGMIVPDAAVFGADAPIYVLSLYQAVFNEFGDSAKSSPGGPAMLNLNFECNESPDYPGVWIRVSELPTT